MDQTISARPASPVIPTAQELYDAIMHDIDADLLTANLPLLNEKYKDETPEQRKERTKRYNAAFAQYQNRYSDFILNLNRRVMEFKTSMRIFAETSIRKQESDAMQKIESQILSA